MLLDFLPLANLLLGLTEVFFKVLDLWLVFIRVVHGFIILSQRLISLFERLNNVLHVADEHLLEKCLILVRLHESEQISLANFLVTVHVQHLKGKLFQGGNVDFHVLYIVHRSVFWREEYSFDPLKEGSVFYIGILPVEYRG